MKLYRPQFKYKKNSGGAKKLVDLLHPPAHPLSTGHCVYFKRITYRKQDTRCKSKTIGFIDTERDIV